MVTKQLIVLKRDLTIKKIVSVSNIIPVEDVVSPQKTSFLIPKDESINIGDLIVLKNKNNFEYIGVVQDLIHETETELSAYPLINITDTECLMGNISGDVANWIIETLRVNFVDINDDFLKIPFTFKDNTGGANLTLEVSNGNLFDTLLTIFKKTGVHLKFSLVYESGKPINVLCEINKASDSGLAIRYDNPIIVDKPLIENSQAQSTNKLLYVPNDNSQSKKDIIAFYLLSDNTITTDANKVGRINGVVQRIVTYTDEDAGENYLGLLEKAEQELLGDVLNHQITLKMLYNEKYDFSLYQKVKFIDKERTYDTYVTKIERFKINQKETYKVIRLGVLRTTLTDKLKSLERAVYGFKQNTTIIESGGGGSGGGTVDLYDGLDSDSTTKGLTARQGKVLNQKILTIINDLVNYYTKNETYSKEEIDQRISAIPKFNIEVVENLPTSNINETTIYLVSSGSESQNLYTEYIYVNGVWEKLGEQKLDLSGYPTIEAMNTAIADALKNYYTISQVDDLLDGKVDKVDGKGLSTNDLTNELLQEIQDGLTKELSSPVLIQTTKAGIYRVPKDCQLKYGSTTTIPSEAYLFIVDTAENRKDFYVSYNNHPSGELIKHYIGFGWAGFDPVYPEIEIGGGGGYKDFELSVLEDCVDLSTDQLINGQKTFGVAPKISPTLNTNFSDNTLVPANWVNDKLDKKQDILTAGNNITITGGIISAELTGSASITLLESPVRIWNLDSGIYKVPSGATIYYYGASNTAYTLPYNNTNSAIMIVNNNVEGTSSFKSFVLFANLIQNTQRGFIIGSTTENSGSYVFNQEFTGSATKDGDGNIIKDTYVKKVSGKGLSSNDFTDTLLTKLNGIADGATKNSTTKNLTLNGGTALPVYATNTTAMSWYAPTAVGSSNQILKSNGSGAPTWINQSSLAVGSATKSTQDGSGNVITTTYLKKPRLLWENKSPTSSFSAQTITLSSSDYNLLLVVFKYDTSTNETGTMLVYSGNSFRLAGANGSNSRVGSRKFFITDTTHYSVDDGYWNGSKSNADIIPWKIYGL